MNFSFSELSDRAKALLSMAGFFGLLILTCAGLWALKGFLISLMITAICGIIASFAFAMDS